MIKVIAGFQVWRIRDVVVHPEEDDLKANQNNRHASVVKSQLKDVVNHDDDRGDKGGKNVIINTNVTYKGMLSTVSAT